MTYRQLLDKRPSGEGTSPSITAFEGFAIAVILIVGAYLRLAHLSFAQFMADDVTLWNMVREFASHPQILTQGMISSIGFANGPFQAYLLLPGLLTAPDPIGAYYVVALLNVASIALLWAFVRAYWGPVMALLAALLFAVNPWAVIYSRRLWGNDMMAPFNVLLVWSLSDLVRFGRGRHHVMPFLWLAIVIQLYNAAFANIAVAALGLAFAFRRIRVRYLACGVALGAVLVAPYALGTVAQSYAGMLRTGTATQSGMLDASVLALVLDLVTSHGYQLYANHIGSGLDAMDGLPHLVSLAMEGAFVAGVAVAGYSAFQLSFRGGIRQAAPLFLPLAATILPVLLLIRHSAPVYQYYMLGGFPFPFLFAALGLHRFWLALKVLANAFPSSFRLLPGAVLGLLVTTILLTHLLLSQEFFAGIQAYAPRSAYGMPLRYTQEIMTTARRLVADRGLRKVYLGGVAEHDLEIYRGLRLDVPTISSFDSNSYLIAPSPSEGKVLYILSPTDWVGEAFSLRFGVGDAQPIEIPPADVGAPALSYHFYIVEAPNLAGLFPNVVAVPGLAFDGSLSLAGFSTPRALVPGRPQPLLLHWVVRQVATNLNIFVRLLDQSLEVGHGAEQLFDGEGRWQPGEEVYQLLSVPTPPSLAPGGYWFLVGGYVLTPEGYYDVTIKDDRGAETKGGVRLGPLAVPFGSISPPAYPLKVPFGDHVVLLGCDLPAGPVTAGGALPVLLHWSTRQSLERDYTVFVQLLDAAGRVVAQHDAQPNSGRYPTSAWLLGDTVLDRHELKLPLALEPGLYHLALGLYSLPSGERLGGAGYSATVPVKIDPAAPGGFSAEPPASTDPPSARTR